MNLFKTPRILLLLLFFISYADGQDRKDTMDLSGEWLLQLDPQEIGEKEGWQNTGEFNDKIHLPGSLDEFQKGNINDEANRSHLSRAYSFTGPAWFTREITIPDNWAGKYLSIRLERTKNSTLWIDGDSSGSNRNVSSAHVYEIGTKLRPGKRRLTLRIDNTMSGGQDYSSHAFSNETQTNWNGVIGDMTLSASDPVRLTHMEIHPDAESGKVETSITVSNGSGKAFKGKIAVGLFFEGNRVGMHTMDVSCPGEQTVIRSSINPDGQIERWDEFSPNIYQLKAVMDGMGMKSEIEDDFGFRDISTKGKDILMNGRVLSIRGTLECAIFPKTGYTHMDEKGWERILTILQSYGLNHIRFHSWCPPKAAFTVADRLGVMIQAEPSMFHTANEETEREAFEILEAYGNHPSFCFMSMGNEQPAGWLDELQQKCRERDGRRLYTATTGYKLGSHGDFYSFSDFNGRSFRTRVLSLHSKPSNEMVLDGALEGFNQPALVHEAGQYCMYPNFKEIEKYDGVLRARNFEAARDSLEKNGMIEQADDFVKASGALIRELYKYDLESVLRSESLAGFQMLDLRDFPGQGTALVGLLDTFWDSKGLISPEEFRQFCNSTVPLALFDGFTFDSEKKFSAKVRISHYGANDLENVTVGWRLTTDGGEVASGEFQQPLIETGSITDIGTVAPSLEKITTASKVRFEVFIVGTEYKNGWDIWVYPPLEEILPPADLMVVRDWNKEVDLHVENGGKVLFFPRMQGVGVPTRFATVQWNAQMAPGQPKTMGVLCQPQHPALKDFPTGPYSGFQWWEILSKEIAPYTASVEWQSAFSASCERAMILDKVPDGYRPIVQMVDDFNRNQRLGLVFETKVGKGKVLVCTLDLFRDLENRPAARQLHHSLLKYASSQEFEPTEELDILDLKNQTSPYLSTYGALVGFDSEVNGHNAAMAIDGDSSTFWHTPWDGVVVPGYPHELQIDLLRRRNSDPIFSIPLIKVKGMTVLPRQDMSSGRIKDYEIYVSNDGEKWSLVKEGTLENDGDKKLILFDQEYQTRTIKFVAKSGYDNLSYVSLAELDVIIE